MAATLIGTVASTLPEDDDHPYRSGAWRPNHREWDAEDLEVEGELPLDLAGVYLRNTENPVHPSIGRYHPFDGDGMVHQIAFADGRASYRNRFVRTDGFLAEQDAAESLWTGMLGHPDQSKRPDGWGARGRMKDASSTDVVVHNGKALTSFWQCGDLYELDPRTLATTGKATWAAGFPSPTGVSAHTKLDERTGELLVFGYGKEAPYLHYGVVGADGRLEHSIDVPLPGPRLPHDMAFTEHYAILNDLPLFWDPDLLAQGAHLPRFYPDVPSRFAVVPRRGSTADIRWFEADPTYVLHWINAFEDGDEVVLDGFFQHDPSPRRRETTDAHMASVYRYLDLEQLKPRPHRWRFNLVTGETREESLSDRIKLVIRATAVDAAGNAIAEQVIDLAPVGPPSVSLVVWPGNGAPPEPGSGLLDFLQPVLVPKGGLLSASATATGTGALTYQWSSSPAMTFSAPTAANTTMTAPNADVFVTVNVRVTDASGASAEATRLVQVGAGLPIVDLTCAGGTVMNDLIRQARDNVNQLLDVSVPLGLPPVGTVNLGKITFSGDCTTNPSIDFTSGGISLFNGFLGGAGLAGTVTTDRVCFTGGAVTGPPELGLGNGTVGTPSAPLCVSLDPADWLRPDPPLPTPAAPAPSDPPRVGPSATAPNANLFRLPTITCPGGELPISGSIDWPGTFPGISLGGAVPKNTTARFDCGFVELTSTASTPWGDLALRGLVRRDGSFDAAVVTKGLRLFGKPSNTDLTGTFQRSANGALTWLVGADITAPSLGTNAVTLPTLHVELGTTGFAVSANGQLHAGSSGPIVDVALLGTITGQDEFAATLTGSLASPWQPLPGLSIAAGSITASVARAGGATTFDVALAVAGDWQPFGPQLSVRQLTARLSNRAAPADCAIASGTTWAELTGTAHVDIGSPAPVIDLTVRACIGIDQPSVLITSTADLTSWKPVPSVDFTLNSVGLVVSKPANGEWTIDVVGNADYAGIALAGRARFQPATNSFVLDAAGDLSGLHLGPVSAGHVVFTNAPVNNYVPVPLPSDPPSGAAPINLIVGLTAFADINLDAGTRTALDKVLNPPNPQPDVLPIPETIRFVAQLGGASLRLEASISFPPGQGLTLFATCPDEAPKVAGKCMLDHKLTTSLRLTTFFLSIDTTGKFGFGGRADLQLASSDGVAPASKLQVTLAASIDVTGPSIDLALYFTGDWVNALGIQGLTLRDLAIQGGVNFASPIPIPTIGFGATVVRLPDNIAKMLGVQNDQPEPMRFVINISPTKPIFELTLGQPDGHALKPVQPISDVHEDTLTIDYASLVFAPLGGDVGPYHYEPGISVGFAGSAMGVPASGSARITLVPPNLHADLDVGDIVLGSGAAATHIHATHLLLDVTLDHVVVEASGGITIPNGPDAAVELKVDAALLPVPSASATFDLDITNWNLPFPGASVRELHASANLGVSFGSLPSGSLTVSGLLRAASVDVTASGSLTLTNGRLTAMSVQGNVSNFAIAGVNFTGPGCDGTGPQTGACVSAGFNAAQIPPLSLGVAGSIGVAGYGASLTASFGPTGIHGSGTLDVPALGSPSITGDLWFGSALQGVTARDGQNVLRQVQQGDFRFTADASPGGVLSGSSLDLDLGKVGGLAWIKGDGTLVFSNRTLADGHVLLDSLGMEASGSITLPSPVPNGVDLSIGLDGRVDFARPASGSTPATPLGFSLTGSISAQSTADPALRALAQGSFTLSRPPVNGGPTKFSFSGDIALPGFTASLSGNIATNLTYCFSGSFTFTALDVNGSGSVGNNCSTPGLRVQLVVGGFSFAGRISNAGAALTASFNDSRQIMIQGNHRYCDVPFVCSDLNMVQDWLKFTTSVSGSLAWSNAGFSLTADFAASGRVVWDVRCASPKNLSPSNTFCRTAAQGARYVLNFDDTIAISTEGNELCATVPGLPEWCIPEP